MFFNRTPAIALIALTSLLSACGGDSSADGLKLTGPNQAKVFKSDGSLQCEEKEVSLDEMRLELAKAGVDVICAQKMHTGSNFPAVCGGGTGKINVYVIHSSNLVDAEKLGFKSVRELPDYKDQTCKN